MFSKIFDRYTTLVMWFLSVYMFFSAFTLLYAPDRLVRTPRHDYVFTHIIGETWTALLYLVVAVICCIATAYRKERILAYILVAIVNLFWAFVSIFPPLFGDIAQGNLLGGFTGIAFSVLLVANGGLCYYNYNKH